MPEEKDPLKRAAPFDEALKSIYGDERPFPPHRLIRLLVAFSDKSIRFEDAETEARARSSPANFVKWFVGTEEERYRKLYKDIDFQGQKGQSLSHARFLDLSWRFEESPKHSVIRT